MEGGRRVGEWKRGPGKESVEDWKGKMLGGGKDGRRIIRRRVEEKEVGRKGDKNRKREREREG